MANIQFLALKLGFFEANCQCHFAIVIPAAGSRFRQKKGEELQQFQHQG